MFHAPVRLLLPAALAAVLALLALAAPASRAAIADASYLARGPGGLRLAVVVRDGRVQAYACDGRSQRAFFTGRAGGGELVLRGTGGARLALRLGAGSAQATLALPGDPPLELTARPARVAIFTVTIRPSGVVTGAAPGGGALGAHLSGAGLYGALAFPGGQPQPLLAPGYGQAPLYVDGIAVRYPAGKAAQALQGEWRWIVTPTRIVGATTKFIELEGDLAVPAGAKFSGQGVGI